MKTSQRKSNILGNANLSIGTDVFEVLVAEDNDLALGNKESELVKAL